MTIFESCAMSLCEFTAPVKRLYLTDAYLTLAIVSYQIIEFTTTFS